ncbi:MAG TPA: hypothetical protein VG737_08990, partial [Cyclobacteriaceae bacterium]|nr:hypothetical protein [Cyclobacteriaceae bacterium]
MALSIQQIDEMNALIEEISKKVKPNHEIGGQSKVILKNILATHKTKKPPVFFKTRREYADQIVNYFVNEKKMARSKFHK